MRGKRTFVQLIFFTGVVFVITILLTEYWLDGTSSAPNISPRPGATLGMIPSVQSGTVNAYQSSPLTPIVIMDEVPSTTSLSAQALATNPLVGELAPDFVLPTLGNTRLTLSDFRGQPVLINFWASWCGPCRFEMPMLMEAYDRYSSEELVILGINFTERDSMEEVETFVNELDISFPILLDVEGHVSTDSYGLIGLPMSVFVDRNGIVKRVSIGPIADSEIDEFLSEILEENA